MDFENPIIKKAFSESPELFQKKLVIEDAEYLSKFNIFIKDKEKFPNAYLKLYQEDFIVEEIELDDTLHTIDYENVYSENSTILGSGETIYATLVKCGLSTIEVVRDMAEKLGIEQKNIGYAGMKDKNAVTAQRISIRGMGDKSLEKIKSAYYFLKNVSRGKGVVGMTNLKGNRFSILVRTENAPITETSGQSREFFNYFYLQRFGSPRFINYEWGYRILRGDYKGTVESILFKQAPRELDFIKKLREKASRENNWTKVRSVLEPVLNIMHIESTILDYLIKNPHDFLGALKTLPDQVQLWVYGLASLLFNEQVSFQARKGELKGKEIPFFLSDNIRDVDFYKERLASINIFPPPFENLRSFPFLRLAHRTNQSVAKASSISIKNYPGASLVSFDLPKGSYATTFLSHYINIISDAIPDSISKEKIMGSINDLRDERKKTFEIFKDLQKTVEVSSTE